MHLTTVELELSAGNPEKARGISTQNENQDHPSIQSDSPSIKKASWVGSSLQSALLRSVSSVSLFVDEVILLFPATVDITIGFQFSQIELINLSTEEWSKFMDSPSFLLNKGLMVSSCKAFVKSKGDLIELAEVNDVQISAVFPMGIIFPDDVGNVKMLEHFIPISLNIGTVDLEIDNFLSQNVEHFLRLFKKRKSHPIIDAEVYSCSPIDPEMVEISNSSKFSSLVNGKVGWQVEIGVAVSKIRGHVKFPPTDSNDRIVHLEILGQKLFMTCNLHDGRRKFLGVINSFCAGYYNDDNNHHLHKIFEFGKDCTKANGNLPAFQFSALTVENQKDEFDIDISRFFFCLSHEILNHILPKFSLLWDKLKNIMSANQIKEIDTKSSIVPKFEMHIKEASIGMMSLDRRIVLSIIDCAMMQAENSKSASKSIRFKIFLGLESYVTESDITEIELLSNVVSLEAAYENNELSASASKMNIDIGFNDFRVLWDIFHKEDAKLDNIKDTFGSLSLSVGGLKICKNRSLFCESRTGDMVYQAQCCIMVSLVLADNICIVVDILDSKIMFSPGEQEYHLGSLRLSLFENQNEGSKTDGLLDFYCTLLRFQKSHTLQQKSSSVKLGHLAILCSISGFDYANLIAKLWSINDCLSMPASAVEASKEELAEVSSATIVSATVNFSDLFCSQSANLLLWVNNLKSRKRGQYTDFSVEDMGCDYEAKNHPKPNVNLEIMKFQRYSILFYFLVPAEVELSF